MTALAKKIGLIVVKLTVSSALLYVVLSKAGIGKVISLVVSIKPAAFIAAVLIFVMVQFIASIRWGLLLREKHRKGRLFSLYMLGAFFNIFLPGLVGGDAVKAYYLYKETGKGTLTLASVVMDRYIGFASLMLVGLIAFPFGLRYFKGSWVEWLLPLIVFSFFLVSFIVLGLRLGRRVKLIGSLYDYFHSYRKDRALIGKAMLLSAVVHVLSISSVYVISMGIGQKASLLSFFVFVPLIAVLSSLPISISGIGIREASSVLLLGFVGVGPDGATAIAFTWFLSTAVGGLGGLYEYLRPKNYPKAPADEKA